MKCIIKVNKYNCSCIETMKIYNDQLSCLSILNMMLIKRKEVKKEMTKPTEEQISITEQIEDCNDKIKNLLTTLDTCLSECIKELDKQSYLCSLLYKSE